MSLWDWLFRRRRREAELDEEVQSHLRMAAQERIEQGEAPDHARVSAVREFGNVGLVKEITREKWGWAWLETLLQDIRHGLRMLRRSPGFTLVVVLSLALGIGANTAIFTLLNALVLRMLPVDHPEQLVQFSYTDPSGVNSWTSYPLFDRIRQQGRELAGVFAVSGTGRLNAGAKGRYDLAEGETVTGGFFPTLGVRPMLGRLLSNDDDRPGNAVAVISYGFWQKRFGGNPDALGARLTLNQIPFAVVGVTPPEFFGVQVGNSPDFWIPMRMLDELQPGQSEWIQPFDSWLRIMGRLRPGTTRDHAQAELQVIYKRWIEEQVALAIPAQRDDVRRMARESWVELLPGGTGFMSGLREGYTKPLQILMGVVGLVLLIACANIATLLLARATVRRREIAMRLAIGASRARLIRQLLTETTPLSLIGGTIGVLIAVWGSHVLLLMVSAGATPAPLALAPNFRVLGFTTALSLLTGVLFGLAPALRATRVYPGAALKQTQSPRESSVLDKALVVTQVALSLVLLAGAGLFLRSLQNLWRLDPGYDRHNVLMFSLDPRLSGHKGTELANLFHDLLAKIRSLPGIRSASLSSVRPVDDEAYFVDVIRGVDGRELPHDQRIRVAFNFVGPGYFSTLGTPLLLGRDFNSNDGPQSPKVAIVNEILARHSFGEKNPIGRSISHGPPEAKEDLEIVGVVKNSRYGGLRGDPRDVLYLPFFQQNLDQTFAGTTFEMRYGGDVGAVLKEARHEVESVDKTLAMFRVKTLATQTKELLAKERLMVTLSGFFSGLSLLLTCIGLYGLMSYRVTSRTSEIGIRMALGAERRDMLWMMLRESLTTVTVGVVVGLAAAWGTTRFVSSMLYGLKPTDPLTTAAATLVLLGVAALAGFLPACRATKVDPMVALRYE
jgi:predicted permease